MNCPENMESAHLTEFSDTPMSRSTYQDAETAAAIASEVAAEAAAHAEEAHYAAEHAHYVALDFHGEAEIEFATYDEGEYY